MYSKMVIRFLPKISNHILMVLLVLFLVWGSAVSTFKPLQSSMTRDTVRRNIHSIYFQNFKIEGFNENTLILAHRSLHEKNSVSGTRNNFSVTNILVFANIVAFLLTHNKPWRMNRFIKNNFRIARGEWYRLISALFLHGSLPHIAMNSMSLMNIGPQVESYFGPWKFLIIYLGSGAAANLITFITKTSPFSIGASGSTFGLLGALATYVYVNRRRFGPQSDFLLDGIKRNVMVNIMYGFMQSHVDNWAHIGGLAAGVTISFLLCPQYNNRSFKPRLMSNTTRRTRPK